MPYLGGTPRLIKSFPCAENFFFSLTDDIFVICNLKVTKNNRNTYQNMHFHKKLPKKHLVHILGYIPNRWIHVPEIGTTTSTTSTLCRGYHQQQAILANGSNLCHKMSVIETVKCLNRGLSKDSNNRTSKLPIWSVTFLSSQRRWYHPGSLKSGLNQRRRKNPAVVLEKLKCI